MICVVYFIDKKDKVELANLPAIVEFIDLRKEPISTLDKCHPTQILALDKVAELIVREYLGTFKSGIKLVTDSKELETENQIQEPQKPSPQTAKVSIVKPINKYKKEQLLQSLLSSQTTTFKAVLPGGKNTIEVGPKGDITLEELVIVTFLRDLIGEDKIQEIRIDKQRESK